MKPELLSLSYGWIANQNSKGNWSWTSRRESKWQYQKG